VDLGWLASVGFGRGAGRFTRLVANLVALGAIAIVVTVAVPARAATQTFTPDADALVTEVSPSTAFGTSNTLRVDGGSDPDVQTYLRFTVSGISGPVQSASLRLWATSPTANGPSVFTTADTWSEPSITWANKPALAGSGVGKVTSIATSTWAAFDVTSIVTGNGTFDLVLAGTSTDGADFSSREATNEPQLVVTTQPTSDTSPPSKPANLTATAATSSRVDLSWSASSDDVGVTGYEISRNGAVLTTTGAVTSYADTSVAASTSYSYSVRALDAAGNRSDPSDPATTTTPAAPSSLTLTPTADSMVRQASPSTNAGTSTVLRVDGGTDPAVETYLRFTVPSLSGTLQRATLRLWVTSPTANGPAVYATGSSWTETGITWNNRPARTGTGVADAGALASGTWATFDITQLVAGSGTYSVALAGVSTDGVDFSSREGANPPQLVVDTASGGGGSGDQQAPSIPTGLTATVMSASRIDLNWNASTDNVGVTGYDIYRNGALITTTGGQTSYSDTAVAPGTTYTYRVAARDLSGNASDPSAGVTVSTPAQSQSVVASADAHVDEASPTTNFGTTTSLRVDGGTGTHVESYLSFTLSGLSGTVRQATLRLWASSGTGDGPIVTPTSTGWTENGITWANKPASTGPTIADIGGISTGTWVQVDVTNIVVGNGTYAFRLSGESTDGVDFHSREGANDPQLVVTMGGPDTQPPTAPSNLRGTAGSANQVDLTWTASTDDVAVANYQVFRGSTQIATIGGATTSYSDTTVSANTTYTYTVKAADRAGNISPASNAVSVTTTTASSAPVIGVAGDIACAPDDPNFDGGVGTTSACRMLATSNLLVDKGFAAVLPLGDEQYNSGSLSSFMASYDLSWGRVKSLSHPVVGNHEYGTSGASGYFSYYGASAGDPSKGYYSFDIGSWHLIALNSNCTKVAGGCGVGSPQETWLRSDLAAHPAACTLAFSHHAAYSSGHDGDNAFMQPMWQDLYNANAELLLSGHSHDYERYAPQNATGGLDNTRGVRQFVVGTGGAFFTGMGSIDPNSQVHNNTTYGILKLALRSTSYDWQFIPVTGSTFTDSGSTACH
jgi:chitodextrinase